MAGNIKGYAGKKYASAAEKYADDYYVKFNETTRKATWFRIKDKSTLLLRSRVERSEAQEEATAQLAAVRTNVV